MSLTDERIIEIVSTGGAVQCREVLHEPLRFGAISYRFSTSGLLEFARAVERELSLKWTDALPTQEGYYWWRSLADPLYWEMVEVYEDEQDGMFWREGDQRGFEPVADRGGQWAGPMPEPTE